MGKGEWRRVGRKGQMDGEEWMAWGWMDEWVDGWRDVCMDGWMNGGREGWRDGEG